MTRPLLIAVLVLAVLAPVTGAAVRKQVKSMNAHGQAKVDATIRNAPPAKGMGYVIGNARTTTSKGGHGVKIDVLGSENGADYGYIFGNFRHCGWVFAVNLRTLKEAPKASCSAGANHHFNFRSFSNGERNCRPGHCKDGSNSRMDYQQPGCQASGFAGHAFANVNPFATPAKPRDQYGTLRDEAYLRWRYTSKDGNWVMVHDPYVKSRPGFPATASDWYFIRRQCLRKG